MQPAQLNAHMYTATSGSQAVLSATSTAHAICPRASTSAAQGGGMLVVWFASRVGGRDGTVGGVAVGDRVSSGVGPGSGPGVEVDVRGSLEHPQAVAHIANS